VDELTVALRGALERVGDRWTLLVVAALLDGPLRFADLQTLGIAPNVLSQRLTAMEADGLVGAAPYQERPLRLRYELSGRGRELAGVVRLLAAWGDEAAGPAHVACGTPLTVTWWCPTCDVTVDAPDQESLHHL
jgi:DNA-binding HxlR family transcriptional regulator